MEDPTTTPVVGEKEERTKVVLEGRSMLRTSEDGPANRVTTHSRSLKSDPGSTLAEAKLATFLDPDNLPSPPTPASLNKCSIPTNHTSYQY